MIRLSIIGIFLLVSQLGWASATKLSFEMVPSTQRLANNQSLLQLTLRDAESHSGACLYYLKGLRFVADGNILLLKVFNQPCLVDNFGKSSGDVYWVVPSTALDPAHPITVLVNSTHVGTLKYNSSTASFEVIGRTQ